MAYFDTQEDGATPMANPFTGAQPQQQGGFAGFLQSPGFGNILQAMGASLMSSPRNAPLSNFGQFLPQFQRQSMLEQAQRREAQQSEQERAALEQALVASGIDPAQARTLSANPQAAKLQLEMLDRQQAREGQNRTLDVLSQQYPEIAQLVGAGLPMNDAIQLINSRRNGQTDDYAQRAQAAAEFGLSPDDPGYQSFILTGKMPREDAQPLTATDKRAILEADDMVAANQNAVDMLSSVLEKDETGRSLNDRAGYGFGADTQSWLARNDPTGLFDDEKGQATTELSNVVLNQALSTLKSTFGAAPTEGERKILVDLQASVDKSPKEREAILKRAIDMAKRRLEFNKQRASQLRGGDYYQPQGAGAAPAGNTTSGGVSWSVEP